MDRVTFNREDPRDCGVNRVYGTRPLHPDREPRLIVRRTRYDRRVSSLQTSENFLLLTEFSFWRRNIHTSTSVDFTLFVLLFCFT